MLSKRIALAETHDNWFATRSELPFNFEDPLPLDNLDENIRCDDALFCQWPKTDFIIGNPPYQSKNKMQREFGRAYLNRLRAQYPDVPGRADYCVYWFRRAQDELSAGSRAGLVGTNTIRQNYSREGGLDHIVETGGTITEAVATQVWSGDAAVHVSIVNWFKGKQRGKKKLLWQQGDQRDSPWASVDLDRIGPSLTATLELGDATELQVNAQSGACYQGQTHGHDGFLLDADKARELLASGLESADVLFPYLIGRELLANADRLPNRYVIDFNSRDLFQAQRYSTLFAHIQKAVLPSRKAAADEETKRNDEALAENPTARINRHHANFLNKWWHLSYARDELIDRLRRIPRYIVCSRVTKRPVFEFISSAIRPSDALAVFVLTDYNSFGILHSEAHWEWFKARCSTLKGDFRYTSNTVFNTFPWPQSPNLADVRRVAKAARALRALREEILHQQDLCLRDLYRLLELPGESPLKAAHRDLDTAVRAAYKMPKGADILQFLLALNQTVADNEAHLKPVIGPGLPPRVSDPGEFIDGQCVAMPPHPPQVV
jgi:hypothetical protein